MAACKFWLFAVILQFYISCSYGRKHNIHLKDETRSKIQLSTFGLLKGGVYSVNISSLTLSADRDINEFSGSLMFTLDKTSNVGTSPYLEKNNECLKKDSKTTMSYIIFDLKKSYASIKRIGADLQSIPIYHNESEYKHLSLSQDTSDLKPPLLSNLSFTNQNKENFAYSILNLTFYIVINTTKEEGLYNFYFHNCPNPKKSEINYKMEMKINIIEINKGMNYLSAGDIPLPNIYFVMSSLFFLSSCYWLYVLRSNKEEVFKIHYLMLLVGYIKALSLLFHAVDYLFIGRDGNPIQSWAVMYYITHLLKGALLFMTIALIGTGWAFVKHILSDRDKKIFMIVIPLQILANVAYIIIESTEESQQENSSWRTVFFLVDLLCCGAILFPVVWSIRHLQDASTTDGKAATSLSKLKLFRHFYILIVCYIYFTRIIIILLKSTVPFQYVWLSAFFTELATYIFYVVTAYKFRPALNNPYLIISQEDEEIEMEEVVTENGVTDGVKRVNQNSNVESTVPKHRDLNNHE